jgi:hypothetical protein
MIVEAVSVRGFDQEARVENYLPQLFGSYLPAWNHI